MPEDLEKSQDDGGADSAEEGGYDRVARLMAVAPDLAIFYRFTRLSAESLLHYQAQLRDAELRLAKIQRLDRDAPRGTHRRGHAFDSSLLRESSMDDTDVDGEDRSQQWEAVREIRGLIKEYYEAMILHHQVANLGKPHDAQLGFLRKWMERPSMGNVTLLGEDHSIWKDSRLDELVTMARDTPDSVTAAMSMGILKLYHRALGRYIHKVAETEGDHLRNSVLYEDHTVLRVLQAVKALVACMLPIIGIVVLNAVKDMSARLGIIAAFTAIFSLALCYMTSAGLKDIFSATAAFSAVLVVFVGTTNVDTEPIN